MKFLFLSVISIIVISTVNSQYYGHHHYHRQNSQPRRSCNAKIDVSAGVCPRPDQSKRCAWCFDQCTSDQQCQRGQTCCPQPGCGNFCHNWRQQPRQDSFSPNQNYPRPQTMRNRTTATTKRPTGGSSGGNRYPTRPTPPSGGKDTKIIELTVKFKAVSAAQSPDGVAKQIIVINDQFPGPTIRAKIGDTIVVRVHNRLLDSSGVRHETSVHYHGIEMKLEPWMDGPEQVTQCPIPYGQHMDYTFTLHQSGTYWYHSHHQWQYIDGFWGWLIIDNKQDDMSAYSYNSAATLKDVHRYDDEMLISLMDWYWKTGDTLTREDAMSTMPGSPNPDSALINGKGAALCEDARRAGHRCDPSVASRAIAFNVVPGLTYRIRLLNPSAKANFNFSIDGHKMRVIETDGVDTVIGRPVDVITLWPAHRYSVLVTMKPEGQRRSDDNYWIRADMIVNGQVVGHNRKLSAVLHHLSEKSPPPSCRPMDLKQVRNFLHKLKTTAKKSVGGGRQGRPCARTVPWNDPTVMDSMPKPNLPTSRPILMAATDKGETYTESKCLKVNSARHARPILLDQEWCDPVFVNRDGSHGIEDAPQDVSHTVTLNMTIPDRDWFVNGRPYSTHNQRVPAIFRVMGNEQVPQEFRPHHTPLGQTVQIVINNQNVAPHPYHLHGHTYYVMGTGRENDGPFNPRNPEHLRLLQGPAMRRDTTHTLANSWSVVRIITNNPGVWILHCHIHWHLDRGLAAVFIEGEAAQRERYRIPDEARRVCKLSGINLPQNAARRG